MLTRAEGQDLVMRGAIFSPDGAERVEATGRFALDDARGPAILAQRLLALAGPAIALHFAGRGEA